MCDILLLKKKTNNYLEICKKEAHMEGEKLRFPLNLCTFKFVYILQFLLFCNYKSNI